MFADAVPSSGGVGVSSVFSLVQAASRRLAAMQDSLYFMFMILFYLLLPVCHRTGLHFFWLDPKETKQRKDQGCTGFSYSGERLRCASVNSLRSNSTASGRFVFHLRFTLTR
ncbi:MAG: hypothetical protein ACLVEJ_04675 [Parabacteroides sp.]